MTKQYDNYADLITFTRASTGTYLDSDGLLKTATTNTPRIEYDANGNRKGLLIEEARTNLYTNSGDMDGTGWVGFRTTYSAGDTSPDGSQLFLLGEASETNINGSSVAEQGRGVSSGTHTMSVFAKAGPDDTGFLSLRPSDSASFIDAVSAWFNLQTGVVSAVATEGGSTNVTTPVATIQDFGGGVYRCSLTFTVVSPITVVPRHYLTDSSGSRLVTVGKQVQLWGAQFEAGSFPTSYISTSGAAASRAADVASIPTSAFGYNADKGTVVVDFETQYGTPVGFPRIWEIGGATSGVDRVYGFISAANSQIRCGVLANGVTAADFSVKTDPTPASGKLAFAFADADFSGVIDGGSPVTDTSGSFTTPSIPRNTLKIGGPSGSAASNMGGHIKSIQYYPRRLTNSQLQRLTS
jgi:hypothetical protein